jgi:hypothetical protein
MLKQRFGNLFSRIQSEISIGGRAGLDRLRPIGLDSRNRVSRQCGPAGTRGWPLAPAFRGL